MTTVRARHELVFGLGLKQGSAFVDFETAAFHLRKSIEDIAFGCLVAMDKGFKKIPRDAQGQWNADKIFSKIKNQDSIVFPESFDRVDPGQESPSGVNHHIVPHNDANLSIDDVRGIYSRLHVWNHEWNPYVNVHRKDYEKRKTGLIDFGLKLWNWIVCHMIGVGGKVFLVHLNEGPNDQVLIASATSNIDLTL